MFATHGSFLEQLRDGLLLNCCIRSRDYRTARKFKAHVGGIMQHYGVRVLMLGEKTMAPSLLLVRLVRSACHCSFAASADDAIKLFEEHKFHMVLSTGPVQQAMRMLPVLARSDCTVFSAFPVENGCWWLPVMQMGQECLGTAAMRTAEFVNLLDETVARIQGSEASDDANEPETHSSLASPGAWRFR